MKATGKSLERDIAPFIRKDSCVLYISKYDIDDIKAYLLSKYENIYCMSNESVSCGMFTVHSKQTHKILCKAIIQ